MRIRPASEEDLPAMADVFGRAGRHMAERYQPLAAASFGSSREALFPTWRHLLATGAGFVAEDPDPLGFATAVIRDGVWFLSHLWVVPERHGEGIGSTLLDEALTWGRGATAFSVVASPDPAAIALYLRRSMYPVWVQHELVGPEGPPEDRAGTRLDPVLEEDQPWIDRLDREVRGVARPEDHRFFREAARGVVLRPRPPGPSGAGYAYAWPSGRIGPAAASDPSRLAALLRDALAQGGPAVSVMVPSANWRVLAELVRRGFRLVSSTTFMASRPFPDGSRYLSGGGALA